MFCCDRCQTFPFSAYFLGDIYTGGKGPKINKTKATMVYKNRPVKQRIPLQILIRTWRAEAHRIDPLRTLRPASWIIDDAKIKKLATLLPTRIRTPSDITALLNEGVEWSSEWSLKLFNVVHLFDHPPVASRSPRSTGDEPPPKRHKTNTNSDTPDNRVTLAVVTNAQVPARTGSRVLRSSTRK
jgi:hypothetical protein